VDWLDIWLGSVSVDWLVDGWSGWLVGLLVSWSIGWLVDGVVG